MPIRINLLADQQAAEAMRRRDPVKRATWASGFLVGVMVFWSGYLQYRLMAAMRDVNRYESEWSKLESEYKKVTTNLSVAAEAERKWGALQSLATNRFLWATPLNALQFVMLTVNDVQLTRLKTDQSYLIAPAIPPSTNTSGTISHGRPGSSRERILLTLDAKDSSVRPGDQISKFQQAITNSPYFNTNLQKVELTQFSPIQEGDAGTRRFVTFTLECQYPDKAR